MTVAIFVPGDRVKITGVTKGKGFQGVVHRYHFHGGPATHGNAAPEARLHRAGHRSRYSRIIKGKRMPGHMGARRFTELGLIVVRVDAERNLLFVRGSVPGPMNGLLTVQKQGRQSRSRHGLRAPHFSAAGAKQAQAVALPAALFDGTVNEPVLHQAVITYLANQRQGTHQTKTRHFVTGGNQKPWRQKGTGRARRGSSRAPHWRHGGIAFGPHPAQLPDGDSKAGAGAGPEVRAERPRPRERMLLVVDAFDYDAPKTSRMRRSSTASAGRDRKVLVLTNGMKPNVFLSGRNLPGVHVMPYAEVTTYHLLWSEVVLIESGAIGETLTPIAEAARRPSRRGRRDGGGGVADRASRRRPKKGGLRALGAEEAGGEEEPRRKPAKKPAKAAAKKAESKPAPKKKGGK